MLVGRQSRCRGRLAVLALALGACAQPMEAAAPVDLPLPTLPADIVQATTSDEELSERQDASAERTAPGGLQLPPEARIGQPSKAPDTPAAAPLAGSDVGDWRELAGFSGRSWDTTGTDRVAVVTGSVHLADDVLMGLVRNQRTTDVADVTVTVGDATTAVAVPVLRPGEPGPFRIDLSDAPPATARAAADGAITVEVGSPAATSTPARDLRLSTWWVRGTRDPAPADTYLWREPADQPPTHVTFGAVEAGAAADRVEVVGAHVDRSGAVLAVTTAVVEQRRVDPGGSVDWVLVVPGPPDLDDAEVMLWGWAP